MNEDLLSARSSKQEYVVMGEDTLSQTEESQPMFVKLTHNHLMRPAGMNSLDLSVGKQAFRDQITEKKLD